MPLPWLNPSNTIAQEKTIFPQRTETIIATLLSTTPTTDQTPDRTPRILADDSNSTGSGGEEFTLRQILDNNFANKKWSDLEKELIDFLSLRRTPKTTSRTRFYLGQAYFFQEKYDDALMEFLLSQDYYFSQSREWIQYVLQKL